MDRKRNEIARSLSMVPAWHQHACTADSLCMRRHMAGRYLWMVDNSRARRARHYGGCAEHMDAGAAGRTATPEEEEKG